MSQKIPSRTYDLIKVPLLELVTESDSVSVRPVWFSECESDVAVCVSLSVIKWEWKWVWESFWTMVKFVITSNIWICEWVGRTHFSFLEFLTRYEFYLERFLMRLQCTNSSKFASFWLLPAWFDGLISFCFNNLAVGTLCWGFHLWNIDLVSWWSGRIVLL